MEGVDEINKVIEREFGGSKKPVFLGGDFNARPDSPTISKLKTGWTVCPSQVVDGTNTAELSYHLSHEHGYATAADGQIHCERSVLQGGSFFAGQLLAQLQAAVWCSAQ